MSLLEDVWFSEWILLVIAERNSGSWSTKGHVFAHGTKYGLGGYMRWVLVVTYSRGSNSTPGALSLSLLPLALWLLYVGFTHRHVFSSWGKRWLLATGNPVLAPKGTKSHSFSQSPYSTSQERVLLALLRSWVRLCLGDGIHRLTRLHYVPAVVGWAGRDGE